MSREVEIVTILKIPLKISCYGGVSPSKIVKDSSMKPKELILILPATMGMTKIYDGLASGLHEKTKLPVWTVSHGGHEGGIPAPPLNTNKHRYTMNGQTEQKLEFIETYLKGVKLRIIGHSAGVVMGLRLLRTSCAEQIATCYFLYPTMHNVAKSVCGRRSAITIKYLGWLTYLLAWICPNFIKVLFGCIYCFLTKVDWEVNRRITLNNYPYAEVNSMKQVCFLMVDLLRTAVEPDYEIIRLNSHRIRFLYAENDLWLTKETFNNLIKHVPDAQAICGKGVGFEHCFMLRYAKHTVDMVGKWFALDVGYSAEDGCKEASSLVK